MTHCLIGNKRGYEYFLSSFVTNKTGVLLVKKMEHGYPFFVTNMKGNQNLLFESLLSSVTSSSYFSQSTVNVYGSTTMISAIFTKRPKFLAFVFFPGPFQKWSL